MKILSTLILTAALAVSPVFAADGPITGFSDLGNNLAAGDWFTVVDVSDTSASANGTNKKITSTNVGAFYISDTAYSSAFNAVTDKGVSKNAIYDYLHLGDADDDGKIDALDLAAAGYVAVNSSGVVTAARTLTGGTGVDVSNGTGAAGDSDFTFDAAELGSLTWGTGAASSFTWTNDLSGTDTVWTFSSGIVNLSTGTLQVGGTDVVTSGGSIGAATATTATAGDSDTSVATTAFVQAAARDTVTGTHSTPSTTTPLSPTWSSVTQVVYYGVTGTINLPAASTYAGRSIIIYNTGAFTVTIDPNSSEVIVRAGTVQTGGVSMTLSSGAGNYVALICDGARWITLGYSGTIAVGS